MKKTFVNLPLYPLDRPESTPYRDLVQGLRQDLAKTGLIIIPDFLTAEGIDKFNAEIEARLPRAFYSEHAPGAYFDDFPGELPRENLNSKTHCLGRDLLLGTEMDALYLWPAMRHFVAAITGHDRVYLHEDPCNALIVQLYKEGCEVGWHFDSTLFTSNINLSAPAAGGVFECVPDLRSDEDPRYDDVREVLLGRSNRVQQHHAKAGALSLMLGRHSFHRVTKVEQEKPRTSLGLTYEVKPGVRLDSAARKRIFGPSAAMDLGGDGP